MSSPVATAAATQLRLPSPSILPFIGRYEFKYLLRPRIADEISLFLQKALVLDRYCQQSVTGRYTVRSIYFDSPSFECFRAKLEGLRERTKFRVRTYGDPGAAPLWLEMKRKRGASSTKEKAVVNTGVLDAIAARDRDGALRYAGSAGARSLLDRLYFRIYRHAHAPVALVAHEREAYYSPQEPTIRVTLDHCLRAYVRPRLRLDSIYLAKGLQPLIEDWKILEVKFTHRLPRWLEHLVMRFNLKRQACSKYCTAVGQWLGYVQGSGGNIARHRYVG